MAKAGRPREFDRNLALQKAMKVFWTYGYEATSLAQLKKAMKITAPSLYAAFGNKESLFREAVQFYLSDSTTARALAQQPTAKSAIHAVLRDAAESFANGKNPPGCLVVLGAINCTPESKEVQEYLRALRLKTPKNIRERLERGIRDGDLPKRAPVEIMAEFYTTVLHGLSIQARDGATRSSLLSVVEAALSAWDKFTGDLATRTATF